MAEEALRKSGIKGIGDVSWGTHICHFYQTKDDSLSVLVPYFKQGLKNNEYCIWVTSDPLTAKEAKASLEKAEKNLDYYLKKAQIEIIEASHWYTKSGKFKAEKNLEEWIKKEKKALKNGYEGLRVAGNTAWVTKKLWDSFSSYEAEVNKAIRKVRMIALCSYFLQKFDSSEIPRVVSNHQFSLTKKGKNWRLIENSEFNQKKKTILEVNRNLYYVQKIFETLHSSLDPEKVLNQITKTVVSSMGYHVAYIATLSPEERIFEIKAFSAKRKLLSMIIKITGFPIQNLQIPEDRVQNSLLSCIRKNRIKIVKNLWEIAYPTLSKKKCAALQRLAGTKNYIAVPLKVDKEFAGGMVVSSPYEVVSEEEINFLKSFAEAASLALKNANLYKKTKLAEEEVQKSRKLYQELWDKAPVAYHVLNAEGLIIEVNQTEAEVLGYSKEEMLGKPVFDFILPSQRKEAEERFKKKLQGFRLPKQKNRIYVKKDGTPIFVDINDMIERNEEGKVLRVLTTMVDITERKLAEEALRHQKSYFQQLFEHSPSAIVLVDENYKIVNINPSFEKIFGYTLEEAYSFSIDDLIVPENSAQEAKSLTQKSLQGEMIRVEAVRKRKDGSPVEVSILVHPIFIDNRIVGSYGIYTDITEEKRAQEKIAFQASLLSQVHNAVASTDLDGNITFWNKYAQKLFLWEREEAYGKNILEFIACSEEEKENLKNKILEAVKQNEHWEGEIPGKRKDGSLLPFYAVFSLVRAENGKPKGFVCVGVDLSERKKVEETLRALLDEKEVLLKEIHHRVKNNMQIISSLLNLQLSNVKEPGVIAAFRESQNRIQSMALIHERLYQSKDLSRVDFSEYLRNLAIHLFHIYQIDSNVIRLKVDTEEVFLDINTAIPCGLLVNELVSNSLKYAFPGGRSGEVAIELKWRNNQKFKLVVRDNGIGLPEDFDIKNTKSLGIQIVTLLVDQLGGILEFKSNGGTVFSIEFEELKYKKRI